MRNRTVSLTLAFLLIAASCLAIDPKDPHLGTWQLDEINSNLPTNAARNFHVEYLRGPGDRVRVVIVGRDANFKPTHSEWVGEFDGRDFPVTGDPAADTRAYTRIDERTLDVVEKKDGKVTGTSHIAVSADGMTRTVTTVHYGTNAAKFTVSGVYNKIFPIDKAHGGIAGDQPGGIPPGEIGGAITQTPPRRIRVSEGIMQGLLLSKVNPKYPPLAAEARIIDTVKLVINVDKSGKVENVRVISGHPLLARCPMFTPLQQARCPSFPPGAPRSTNVSIRLEPLGINYCALVLLLNTPNNANPVGTKIPDAGSGTLGM